MGPEKSGLDCLFVLFSPSGAPFPDGIVEIDDVCLEPVPVLDVKEKWFFTRVNLNFKNTNVA